MLFVLSINKTWRKTQGFGYGSVAEHTSYITGVLGSTPSTTEKTKGGWEGVKAERKKKKRSIKIFSALKLWAGKLI